MHGVQTSLFGEDFHPLNYSLERHCEEVTPATFYRELFPDGSLGKAGEKISGKYRGVAVRIRDGKARRFSINDGLEVLDLTANATPKEFWVASPVSYAGRTQRQEMARHLYAVAIDLDGVRIEDPLDPRGLGAMWNQIKHGHQPSPTFIVSSGTGLHMYYVLEQPLAMYRTVVRQLHRFRRDLIRRVWSSYVTELWKAPQYESVTQGFRMVGTFTKAGGRVKAFRAGPPVSIEYLNEWVNSPNQVTEIYYKSDLSLAEAREKYPDWYQRRIVEQRPRGSWTVKRALYDWWLEQKLSESQTGHRYFYLMTLAIYAMKCAISEEELHRDAWTKAVPKLRERDKPGNPLTDADVVKALEMYHADYQTFPRRSIEAITGIRIDPNKRNGRSQDVHLRGARAVQAIDCEVNRKDWRYHGGAPTKQHLVQAWQAAHPGGRPIDCERGTGISRHTVLKWWNS